MDRSGIAARVRELLAIEHPEDVTELALRLNVSEHSLRMTIDELAPHPTIEVLSAIVAHYGVDPSWVLTGDYDYGHHRRTADADSGEIRTSIRELTSPRITPLNASNVPTVPADSALRPESPSAPDRPAHSS
jgi:hypothetical protein